MTAVERIKEYSDLPQEDHLEAIVGKKCIIQNLYLKYLLQAFFS